jgi:AbiV family abortive infection protein
MSVTRPELETICHQCIENVQALLTSVSLLLEEETTRKYALGLYMYAIEEYGKAWLLKEQVENEIENKEKKDEYSKQIFEWIFGIVKRNVHTIKIKVGVKHLPEQCKRLSAVLEIHTNTSSSAQTFTLADGKAVSVLPGTTGLVEGPGIKRIIEFNYKTRCFYVDLDSARNEEINSIPIDKSIMDENIRLFKEALNSF